MGLTLELWLTNEDIWGQYWGEKCLKRTKSPVISPKICPKSLLSACSDIQRHFLDVCDVISF